MIITKSIITVFLLVIAAGGAGLMHRAVVSDGSKGDDWFGAGFFAFFVCLTAAAALWGI